MVEIYSRKTDLIIQSRTEFVESRTGPKIRNNLQAENTCNICGRVFISKVGLDNQVRSHVCRLVVQKRCGVPHRGGY